MLGDSTNFNNLRKKEVTMSHAKKKKKRKKHDFFTEITKRDYKFSKTFCFIKVSYVLAGL